MKLALFNDYVPAVVNGEQIVDVSGVVGDVIMRLRPAERMPAIIADFERLREPLAQAATRSGIALSGVQLRAPLPYPNKILCCIGNYMEGTSTPKRPLDMFIKASTSVLDPGGTVRLPPHQATVFHHEGELAVVIGRKASQVSEAGAMDCVFGYTCFLDVSARGLGIGITFAGKSFDTFGPMGPWIVTKDEIPDPQKVQIRVWVDGQPRHDYNTDDMEHPVTELVSWASSVATLEVGDLISCGTNHQGIGPVQDGEKLEIEIERIGRMGVRISDPLKRSWPKAIDQAFASFVRDRRLQSR